MSHWSVTTPELNSKGRAMTIEPPEILNYATDERLIPYMYNDSTSGALMFYAFPSNATTANTKYSRTELREQMVPGDNNTNWTFAQGGYMKGKLAIEEVSRDSDGKYHKLIIMQIHGRLTDEQRDLIGKKDNNAPPMLKIYWQDGKIRVKTKELKNLNATDEEMLHEDAWGDDKGFTFEQEVGFKKFTLEKQKEIGKKYRRQHWQGLKNLFFSPKFLLEYVLFGVAYYICFLNFTKLAIVFGMILLMLPTFYSGFHSIKNKMARRSLNIVLTTGVSLLPWSLYNLSLQVFNMTFEGEENKPYYLFLILTILCYPLMRSGLNIYLKIFNDFKNQYHLMVNS